MSVFIAVVFAFGLNNWNDNRKDSVTEQKILSEISNGLKKDVEDIKQNIGGHKGAIIGCNYWRRVINNKPFGKDSLQMFFSSLTRDYISIQNKAGYETLKSKGLELIKNDDLRLAIISIYEYDYEVLRKLEESYNETQFHTNYYKDLNRIISPYIILDEVGNIKDIELPEELNRTDKNTFIGYLLKIESNRMFILNYYTELMKNTSSLILNIDKELK